jgi:pseudouridine-5'-phosphate glycosidase
LAYWSGKIVSLHPGQQSIFTHGLPRPLNLEVALEAEERLRSQGVVPATIGVFAGVPTVGLSREQITSLSNDAAVKKVSLRDLPVAAALRFHGGTTVAATAFLAHRAGIKVFSTGGLGGVHHRAATSFDESADMTTLATTPIVVVSAGESILDVAATLERFETLNIPVVGYKTTKYPGFYVSDSGFEIEYAVNTPDDVVAAICRARDDLHIASAILLANPIAEDKQFPPAELDDILSRAWAQAEKNGITGKATTPFLLDFIQRETNGRSLNVNVDVYRNNVSLGGEVAIALTANPGNDNVRCGQADSAGHSRWSFNEPRGVSFGLCDVSRLTVAGDPEPLTTAHNVMLKPRPLSTRTPRRRNATRYEDLRRTGSGLREAPLLGSGIKMGKKRVCVNVHTRGFGFGCTGCGLRRIGDDSGGVAGFRGVAPGSSPTSGTFSQVRGPFWVSDLVDGVLMVSVTPCLSVAVPVAGSFLRCWERRGFLLS